MAKNVTLGATVWYQGPSHAYHKPFKVAKTMSDGRVRLEPGRFWVSADRVKEDQPSEERAVARNKYRGGQAPRPKPKLAQVKSKKSEEK